MVGLTKSFGMLCLGALFMALPLTIRAQTAPVFTSSPILTGVYGTQYQYLITTDDAEGSLRTIILSDGTLPGGLTLTDQGDGTAILNGFPQEVGSFPIEIKVLESDSPFQEEVQSFTLVVEKALLLVTAVDKTREYGQPNPVLTFSFTGFLNGDDVSDLSTQPTISTTALPTSSVGDYPITLIGGSDNNYTLQLVDAQLTVTKAILTATAANQSRVYGATNPTLTFTYSGFLNGDDVSDLTTQPTISTTALLTSSVGDYPITLIGGSDNNYTLQLVDAQLTVIKAILTATAANQSRVYGDVNPTLTFTYSGFLNGDDVSDLTTQPTISTTALLTSSVGDYPITLIGGSDNNYTLQLVDAQLTVTKAILTATAANQNRVYGDVNPTLTFTYSGFLNGDDVSDLNSMPTISTTALLTSSVGVYPITLIGGSDNNYTLQLVDAQLTVTKAILTATAANQSRVYGATNPTLTFTYSGFLNGDDVLDLTTQPTISTTALPTSSVGDYPITLIGGSDNNYTLQLVDAQLTVTKAILTVTAANQSRVYGDANPILTFTYSGFLNGDDVSDLTTQPTISTTALLTSSVGDYPITLIGGSDNNYTLQLVNAQLTVTKAILTATSANQSRVYGDANPILTFTYSGFLNGDDVSDLTTQPTISTTALLTSSVGDYPITLIGGSDNNYTLQLVNAQLTVTKAILTATAPNQSRVYGATNPTLTFTYSGFLNGDDVSDLTTQPTISTTALLTSPVGDYPITLIGGSDNNYDFQYLPAQLTISKSVLSVSVNNASKIYLQPNPSFPLVFNGFKNNDDVSDIDVAPSVLTTADLNSNAGLYPITISGGDDGNYSFSYQSATLTIIKATAIVEISNLLQNVDGSPKPVSIQTTPANLNVVVQYNGSTSAPSAKGTYAIVATIQEQNYEGSSNATYILNGAPVLLSIPSITTVEDSGGQQLNISALVDDLEQSETTLQYDILSVTNQSLFSQLTMIGINLSLVFAPDKYGVGSIQIRVTDAQGLFVDLTLPVSVSNVQDPPVFTSAPVVVAAQDVLYTYLITANDVDLIDLLTISSSIALPNWLTLTNHGNGTATLTGTPRTGNIGTSGNGIALKVVDNNGGRDDQFFTINVLEGQFPPQFTSTGITTARENTAYSYTATTSDFNGGSITYTAPTLPNWLTATANGTGGFVLSGSPELSHVYFENGNQDFPVVIRATDNTGLFTEQSFLIRVLYENSPPTLVLQASQITIDEDSDITDFLLTGITDGGEVGQVITITTTANPTNILQSTVDYQSPQTTAIVKIQPILNMNGSTTVNIKVQDNGKASKNFVNKTFTVVVNPINDPPSMISSPVMRVNLGTSYSYTVMATDPDAPDNLTFQLLNSPGWLSLNNTNSREALLSGTAPINGTDALVRIRVSDPSGTFDIQEYNLIVNKPPVLTASTAETNEDIAIEFPKTFFESLVNDPNLDGITTFKITQLSQGLLRFNGQAVSLNQEIPWSTFNQLTYTPPLDYFGQDSFGWNVSDGLLFAENQTQVNITISTTNDPPEIRNLETAPITYSQGDSGSPISAQLTIADVDDASLIGALITISQSFEPNADELFYAKPDGETSPISSSFNKQTGELTLSGEASKSAYEDALRNVKYKSSFLGQTDKLSRRISIQVSDVLTSSAVVQRNLTIIRVLPDIDLVQAFTPNGDGVNDTWDFANLIAYESIRIFVFDNGGRKVYECQDSNCAWDGTFKGKELPPGPYLYTIDLEEGRRQYQGTVTILR